MSTAVPGLSHLQQRKLTEMAQRLIEELGSWLSTLPPEAFREHAVEFKTCVDPQFPEKITPLLVELDFVQNKVHS